MVTCTLVTSLCVHFVTICHLAHVLTFPFSLCPRAVEQSLADTRDAAQMMGMSSVTFFTDPLNPHERKRNGRTPVGLKNLGNTCWFSVVVQVMTTAALRREGRESSFYLISVVSHIIYALIIGPSL